jgi:DMSO reductase family type II enzyme chaperone
MNVASRPAARAGLYRLLALGFAPPERLTLAALRQGDFQDAVAACVAAAGGCVPALPTVALADAEIESNYLALFEAGQDGALALREGAHVNFACADDLLDADGGAPTLNEDLLRFYHYFGFGLSREPARKLPPDHVVCQFEMLSRLCEREGGAETSREEAEGCRRAQQDFLQRHLAAWWPQAVSRLRGVARADGAHDFYCALAELALACITAHSADLSAPRTTQGGDDAVLSRASTCSN